MKNVCCVICKKEYPLRGIFTHYDRTHLRETKYSNGYNGKYSQISKKAQDKKEQSKKNYLNNPNKCDECNKALIFNKRSNKFCSRSCSAMHNNRLRIKSGWQLSSNSRKQISEKLSKRSYTEPQDVETNCLGCGTKFTYLKVRNKERKYCSKSCSAKYSLTHVRKRKEARLLRTPLANYRSDCAFKFSLNDYPEEFNFSLIEKYGWYKPKNKGDNPNGISRDHIVSVKYGFNNGINPEIISHPANCQLLRHNDNVSKYTSCTISIEELLEKIKLWNKKYSNLP